MTLPSGKTVIVLELGDGIELAEALTILGQHFPKQTGTAVYAAIRETDEAIVNQAKGRAGSWPPPLQHKG